MRLPTELSIRGVATHIPSRLETVADVVERGTLTAEQGVRLGVDALPVSDDLAGPQMAVEAARAAFAQGGVDPSGCGVVAHAFTYHQGFEKWSVGHYLASRLGLPDDALIYGAQALCTGAATSVSMAAAVLASDAAVDSVLITSGERYAAPVWDRWTVHGDIGYGDSGAALVLGRRGEGAEQLVLHALSHSSASYLEEMERGDEPFSTAPLSTRPNLNTGRERTQYYNRVGKEIFPKAAREHVNRTLDEALDAAGLEIDDPRIRLMAIPRLGPRLTELLYFSPLEGRLKAEIVHLGRNPGHLGAGDFIANLTDILRDDLIRPGDYALIGGAGGGFGWSTAVVSRPASAS